VQRALQLGKPLANPMPTLCQPTLCPIICSGKAARQKCRQTYARASTSPAPGISLRPPFLPTNWVASSVIYLILQQVVHLENLKV
jgi:hypothetical protein